MNEKYERDEAAIMLQLKKDYARLLNEGYCVFGCFLYGSQNYDLDHANSDIDVKAIIIPEFSKVYDTNWKVTMFRPNGDHVDIITLKEYIYQLKTGYHNWIELLYTKYYYCPPKFRKYWEQFRELRERIVKYDDFVCLDTLSVYLNEQVKIAAIKENQNDLRRENKRLAYTYRIKRMIDNYLLNLPYENNFHLSLNDIYLLKEYKLNTTYNLQERLDIMNKFIDEANQSILEYKNTHKNVIDIEVFNILYSIEKEVRKVAN